MAKRAVRKVEAHAHVLTPAMFGAAGAYGPEKLEHADGTHSFRSGKYQTAPFRSSGEGSGSRDPHFRRAQMDKLGIDVMGVTISPLFYCYGAGNAEGVRYAKACNDIMEEYCEAEPGRFFFIPTLPMQDIRASMQEFERVRTLKWARGVNLSTDNIAGRELYDEELFPIFEICEAADVPLFLHPAAIGTDDPNWDPARNKKDIFNFGWIAGYIYRESLAYGNLVLGGVLDRFPHLKICLTHGGGFVPYQIGRFGEAAVRMPASKAKKPIREYDKNFYFENSVHDEKARNFLLDMWGIDNVYTGSNFDGWDANDGFTFAQTMARNEEELHKLWAGTSMRLFNLGDEFGVEEEPGASAKPERAIPTE